MPSILVVQNNNIGDLVLATPFIGQLHREYPDATIHVIANDYNAPVLERNPHIDRLYAHGKMKHRQDGDSPFAVHWRAVCLVYELRRVRYDYVFLLSGSDTPRYFRLAGVIGARHIVGCRSGSWCHVLNPDARPSYRSAKMHSVGRSLHLLQHAFPYHRRPPATPSTAPCRVYPARAAHTRWLTRLSARGLNRRGPIIALQISARRPRQRWPVTKFAELARRMTFELGAQVLLLWSPGAYDSPTHPGDDAKALAVRELCDDFTIFLCPTPTLQELIAVLSVAEVVVSSEGGATHLAAACERPVIALFGDADPEVWHPWCRDYRIVRSGSADVVDITVQEVFDATMAMIGEAAATVGVD